MCLREEGASAAFLFYFKESWIDVWVHLSYSEDFDYGDCGVAGVGTE